IGGIEHRASLAKRPGAGDGRRRRKFAESCGQSQTAPKVCTLLADASEENETRPCVTDARAAGIHTSLPGAAIAEVHVAHDIAAKADGLFAEMRALRVAERASARAPAALFRVCGYTAGPYGRRARRLVRMIVPDRRISWFRLLFQVR